jgi:hypothetical protein
MTKISEYSVISNPEVDDLLIGTDKNNSDITKNFSIGSIIDLIGNIYQGPVGPQGDTGPTGPQGPAGPAGLEWRGEWSSDASYVQDEAVGYSGASYFCINDTPPSAITPDLDVTNWALLASQGAVGPAGPAGPTGPQGPIGAGARPYKVYSVFFSQSGENNPVITTEYENTVGNITWVRGSAGNFTGTLTGAFPGTKTFFPNREYCKFSDNDSYVRNIYMTRAGNDTIAISQNDGVSGVDGLNMYLEIRVYN